MGLPRRTTCCNSRRPVLTPTSKKSFPALTRGGTLVLRDDEMLDCRTFLERLPAMAIDVRHLADRVLARVDPGHRRRETGRSGDAAAAGDRRRASGAGARGRVVPVRGEPGAAAEHLWPHGIDGGRHRGRVGTRRRTREARAHRASLGEPAGLCARLLPAARSHRSSRRTLYRR